MGLGERVCDCAGDLSVNLFIKFNQQYCKRGYSMSFRVSVKDENKIYHYCKLSTALEHILPNEKLRISPIISTNDPRENKDILFKYGSNNAINTPDNILELDARYSNMIRKDCKVLCFSQDYKNYQGCQLSKMWYMYGDNHKGVCLEINKKKFIEENHDIINPNVFKKINYLRYDRLRSSFPKDIRLKYFEFDSDEERDYILKYREDNIDYLFFSKNDEWESESETRLIVFSNKEHEYCSLTNSLENIHLGIDFHDSNLPSIKKFCKNSGIFKMKFYKESLVCGEL